MTPTGPVVISLSEDEADVIDTSANNSNNIVFPHPSWSEYFKKIGENRRSMGMFYAQCQLCLGRKSISCSYGSAGNLRKHIEVSKM